MMKLSRFIAISMLVSGLTSIVYAQQIDNSLRKLAPAADSEEQEVALESSTASRGAAGTNLFAKVKNPFEKTTETSDSTASTPTPQAVDPDKWRFQFTPYLWIAGVSGRAGIGNLVVNIDAGITDDNVHLNFGFMSHFEARKNRFVILTDLEYSSLGTERPTPGPLFSTATADFKTFMLAPEAGYRIVENPEKGASIDVLGGIRYWHLKTDLTFNAGLLSAVSASRSRSWVDVIAGFRGKTNVSKRVFITGEADVGGGGSNFTYQLFGGVGVLVGSRYALIAGYRDLDVNYNKDGFLFDTALQGPILGLGIRF